MTRWNKKQYLIIFQNGERVIQWYTDKQVEKEKGRSKRIGSIIEEVRP